MNTSALDLALRAQKAKKLPFEKRTFMQFTASGLGGESVTLAFEANRYKCGAPLQLQIWSSDKEDPSFWTPYVTLTKNAEPSDCEDGEIVVKTVDENAHLRDVLLKRGFFEDTGRRLRFGYSELEIWALTEKFVEAFEKVHPIAKSAKEQRTKAFA